MVKGKYFFKCSLNFKIKKWIFLFRAFLINFPTFSAKSEIFLKRNIIIILKEFYVPKVSSNWNFRFSTGKYLFLDFFLFYIKFSKNVFFSNSIKKIFKKFLLFQFKNFKGFFIFHVIISNFSLIPINQSKIASSNSNQNKFPRQNPIKSPGNSPFTTKKNSNKQQKEALNFSTKLKIT